MKMNEKLQQRHLDDLRASGLSDETIIADGYSSASAEEVANVLDWDAGPGMEIEYPTVNGVTPYARIKPDNPVIINGRHAKYLTPKGAGNRLFIPLKVREVFDDPGVDLFITEGEKKASKATQDGYPCIGLSGVWNFRESYKDKHDKKRKRVLPELKEIDWDGRRVFIVFDSDAAENSNVRQAEAALAKTLQKLDADVRIVRLPAGANGDKVGLDDFLVAEGPDAFQKLLTSAEASQEEPSQTSETQPVRLVNLALEHAELFHDRASTPYMRIQHNGSQQIYRCGSRGGKRWLSRLFFEAEDRAANTTALAEAVQLLEAKALFDGEPFELHNRVAEKDGTIWYDLTDEKWRAIRITSDGWAIIDVPPILFLRHEHQTAQVEPVAGGDINRLFEFIAITDEQIRLLLKVWLVACFIPSIPHPVPVLHGPQDSGKSSAFRILRRLIDPSLLEGLSLPRDHNELIQMLSHHWMALFDNVDTIQPWQSDVLCRAVTGEGFSKRQLFTDDEDVIYCIRRCIGLNGINIAATRVSGT
jgi:hypothetical protein